MKKTIVSFMALLALGACQREKPAAYYAVNGRLFVFNYRVSQASYMVTLARLAPVPDGLTIIARFQDPAGGVPIVITRTGWPKLEKIVLGSPPIRCVKANIAYGVEISVNDASGKTVQTLSTTVTSNIDQTVLAAKPLLVGPVYVPNREIYKPDGPDFAPDTNCPA
jgi:hypothetical protein